MKPEEISRRTFLKILTGAGLTLSPIFFKTGCTSNQNLPNIILIFTDDQGIGDVSLYGSDISTPNIDSIGKNGIQFNNFYVTAPVCTPSRYGLLTGRYHYRIDKAFHAPLMPGKHDDKHLPEEEITIAQLLKQKGYRTALIGKWHLGHGQPDFGPNKFGFDYFYGFLPGCIDYYLHTYRTQPALFRNKSLISEEGFATDLLTTEAVKFIKKNRNFPFFLYLAYNAPHYGKCPEGNLLQSPPEYPNLPPKSKNSREVYSAMVENLDKNIGIVLNTLKDLHLEKNTLVIFLSDNGGDYDYGGSNHPYRGEKATLWEGGIKTPCLMQWKGRIAPYQKRDQVCSSLDIFPTLASITGSPLPTRELDGRDISAVIFKNQKLPNRYLFFQYRKQMAVRDDRWKYIKDVDGREYLFDLVEDPLESQNLIEKNPQKAAEMRTAIEKFIQIHSL